MKKQHLIIILLFSFLLAVPAVQAQKKFYLQNWKLNSNMAPTVSVKDRTLLCRSFAKTVWVHSFTGGYMPIPGGEWNNKTYHGAAEWLESVGQSSDYGLAGTYETMESPTV